MEKVSQSVRFEMREGRGGRRRPPPVSPRVSAILPMPPDEFSEPVPPIPVECAATDTKHTFYPVAKPDDTSRTFANVATRNRSHFVHALKRHKREQNIAACTRERVRMFQAMVAHLDKKDWNDFGRRRHEWRQTMSSLSGLGPRVCAVEDCCAVPLTGSDFCMFHITRDANQTLFIECEKCGRVYPRCGACFMCGS
jgi:hypothetical protein